MIWRASIRALLLSLALGLTAPYANAQSAPRASFPHAKHSKLFPTCAGCHGGIGTDDSARFFPAVTLCSTCHDGSITRRVPWSPPVSRGPGLLVFSHARHVAKAKDATCVSCHAVGDTTRWMNVAAATPERCFACHAHAATAHLAADNACTTCHRPLTRALALTDNEVGKLPQPPSHSQATFLTTHGTLARASTTNCAVCHSRESCQRCHVDGARQRTIVALGTDVRVARLSGERGARYSTPADHGKPQFVLTHGSQARASVERCAVCHARPGCETCHIGEGAREVIQRLPNAREATAPGVQLQRTYMVRTSAATGMSRSLSRDNPPAQLSPDTTHRVRVHPTDFWRAHGAVAAAGQLQCTSCHAQHFCSDCHAGERVARRYHPPNFVSTHAPQAYSRQTDCSSCHSAEAFCRSCHRQLGLAAKTNARSTVFHNAQPLWLLQHGRAARQDLNACATCHQQTYCMQCHSDLGARINPHGPGFDAARMQKRNPGLCLTCHFTNPLAK